MTITGITSAFSRRVAPVRGVPSESTIALALRCVRDFFAGKKAALVPIPNMPHAVDVKSFLTDVVFTARVWMGDTLPSHAMGLFSFVTMLGSYFAVKQTTHQAKEAYQLGDGVGLVTRSLSATDWVSRGVIGASAVSAQTSSIYQALTHAGAGSTAGSVAVISNGIMDIAFGVTCAAIGLQGIIQSVELGIFGTQFELAGRDIERMEFLMKDPVVNVKEWAEKAKSDPKSAKLLEELAIKVMARSFSAASRSGEKISEEKAKELFETIIASQEFAVRHREALLEMLKMSPKEAEGLSFLSLVGLVEKTRLKVALEQKKKERLLSPSMRKTIDKMNGMGLIERLKSGTHPEVQEMAKRECARLTKDVRIDLVKKAGLLLWVIALGVLGTAFAIASYMALVGSIAMPPTWLVVVFLTVMVGIDAFYMHNALKTAKPEKNDYRLLAAGCVVVLAAFAVTAALTFTLHIPIMGGLVKAAVVTGSTLGFAGYAWYKLGKREKEWRMENPTLKDFAEFVQEGHGEVPKELSVCFDRLSKEDQLAIMSQYKRYSLRNYRNGLGAHFLYNLNNARDEERYVRGVEKAAAEFWKEYRINKTQDSFEEAMSLQRFRDLIVDKNFKKAGDYLREMCTAAKGRALVSVHEIMLREESLEDLRTATQSALKKQTIKTL